MDVGVGIRERIFGYYIITVDKAFIKNAASLVLKLGICATIFADGCLCVGIKDSHRFLKAAPKEWITHISKPRGLYGVILSYRHCIGAAIGCVFALFFYIFLGSLVWDVRIEGNSQVNDTKIVAALEEVGFGVGSIFPFVDIGKTETELLTLVDEISWVSINRKGTVAYVVVKERAYTDTQDKGEENGYCDIVAKSDGVIYSITVKSGTPLVKVGDTVKAGQVLIGGYIDMDGKVTPTRAEGEILAECSGEISVFVTEKEEKKSEFVGEYIGARLKIFKFCINLFKNSGKIENECDIIEDEEVYMLFGRYRLPISFTRVYTLGRENLLTEYSESEMTEIAAERMKRVMSSFLASGEIVKLRSLGEFCEGGYRLTNHIVYLDRIGIEKIITQDVIEERSSD